MTDTKALRDIIKERGIKYKRLAEELSLSPYGLQKKIENDTEFKISEVSRLAKMLNMSVDEREQIFFAS